MCLDQPSGLPFLRGRHGLCSRLFQDCLLECFHRGHQLETCGLYVGCRQVLFDGIFLSGTVKAASIETLGVFTLKKKKKWPFLGTWEIWPHWAEFPRDHHRRGWSCPRHPSAKNMFALVPTQLLSLVLTTLPGPVACASVTHARVCLYFIGEDAENLV